MLDAWPLLSMDDGIGILMSMVSSIQSKVRALSSARLSENLLAQPWQEEEEEEEGEVPRKKKTRQDESESRSGIT